MNIEINETTKTIAEKAVKSALYCIAANAIVKVYYILELDNYMEFIEVIKKEYSIRAGTELLWNDNKRKFSLINSVTSVSSVAKKLKNKD